VSQGSVALAQAEAAPVSQRESQSVRRMQVDVSVIDPRGSAWASVRGIPRDAFELRLDGALVAPELAQRIEFDEVCQQSDREVERPLVDAPTTLLLLLDLNYLDPRMRFQAADAIDALARRVKTDSLRVKVLAFSRRLLPLTHDFTDDEAELRAVARDVRQVSVAPLDLKTETEPGAERAAPPKRAQTSANELVTILSDNEQAFQFETDIGKSLQAAVDRTESRRGSNRPALERFDARPSLAAIESLLVSHAHLRGRKSVVIFTSAAFDLPDDLWWTHATATRDASQGGFTVWAVDLSLPFERGIAVQNSKLLDYITNASGGDAVRVTGSAATVFDRVLAQQSCYYLFSIPLAAPVKSRERHTVDVKLDTDRYPQYWPYRVRTISDFVLLDPTSARTSARLAALMEPGSYRTPRVEVTISYPDADRAWSTVVETSVDLSQLRFVRDGASYRASFGWEGVISDDGGATYCVIGDGVERTVRVEQPPQRSRSSMLVLRTACRLPGPGRYDVRVLIEDFATRQIGAANTTLIVRKASKSLATVAALRLGRNSGRDFLLSQATGGNEVPRDLERVAFIPLSADEPSAPDDRVLVRFVACGATRALPHAVVFQDGETPKARFQLQLLRLGAQSGAAFACTEYEGMIPEGTLEPGDYRLALFAAGAAKETDQIEKQLRSHTALATIGLRVRPTPVPPNEPSTEEARLGPTLFDSLDRQVASWALDPSVLRFGPARPKRSAEPSLDEADSTSDCAVDAGWTRPRFGSGAH
jgi:hypothetical protein